MIPTLDKVLAVLRGHRFSYSDEEELQEGLAAALTSVGLNVQREVRFDERSRIDLLVGGVGIEVKVKGGVAEVFRQLCRYAPHVDELVLVTIKASHRAHLPDEVEGVPLTVEFIAGGAL